MGIQKVTQAEIDAQIEKIQFINAGVATGDDALSRYTICFVTLKNNFVVTGESSCLNKEDYSQVTGEKIALKNAKEKLWMLFGFARADEFYKQPKE